MSGLIKIPEENRGWWLMRHWPVCVERVGEIDKSRESLRALGAALEPIDRRGRIAAVIRRAMDRLQAERRVCGQFLERIEQALELQRDQYRDVMRDNYLERLTPKGTARKRYMSERNVSYALGLATAAIYTGLVVSERVAPSGYCAFDAPIERQWGPLDVRTLGWPRRGQKNCHEYLLVDWVARCNMLAQWGAAPEALWRISDDVRRRALSTDTDTDADADRQATAAEWWLRVWDGVDGALRMRRVPDGRHWLTAYYRRGMSYRQMAHATRLQCPAKVMQSAAQDMWDAVDDDTIRLSLWRTWYARALRVTRTTALPGLDAPPRVTIRGAHDINWREVERLLTEDGYQVCWDRLIIEQEGRRR